MFTNWNPLLPIFVRNYSFLCVVVIPPDLIGLPGPNHASIQGISYVEDFTVLKTGLPVFSVVIVEVHFDIEIITSSS